MTTSELRKQASKLNINCGASLSQNRDFWIPKIIVKEVEMIVDETEKCCVLKKLLPNLEYDQSCHLTESQFNKAQEKALKTICKEYLNVHPRVIRHCGLIPVIRIIKIKSKVKKNADLASGILKEWRKQVDKATKEC